MVKPRLKKRWLNALKIAARINRLIKQGNMLIWDGEFISNTGRFYLDEHQYDGVTWYELIWTEDSKISTLYFSTHPNRGDGQDDTIEEYSKWFKDIKVIPKECIKEFRVFMAFCKEDPEFKEKVSVDGWVMSKFYQMGN